MNFQNDLSAIVACLKGASYGDKCNDDKFYFAANDDFCILEMACENLSSAFADECIRFFVGGTKAVIKPFTKDYVIKLPFNCSIYEISSSDDDDDEDNRETSIEFEMFQGLNNEINKWDYCAEEERIYNLAKELGIADMFAATVKATDVFGYPVYMSEKAEVFADVNYGTSSNNETIRSKFYSDDVTFDENPLYKQGEDFYFFCKSRHFDITPPDRMDCAFLGYMLEYYGKEKVIDLCVFLQDCHLNDFHCENVGFVGDRPVLIDYSGFFEDY